MVSKLVLIRHLAGLSPQRLSALSLVFYDQESSELEPTGCCAIRPALRSSGMSATSHGTQAYTVNNASYTPAS
jgi:hypothetical protein